MRETTTDNPADDAAEAAADLRELDDSVTDTLDDETEKYVTQGRPRYRRWLRIFTLKARLDNELALAEAEDPEDAPRVAAFRAQSWAPSVAPSSHQMN